RLTSSSRSGNQWYRDGLKIEGATDQEYVATAVGNYIVDVTANGYSSERSAPTIVFQNPPPLLRYTSFTTGSTGTFDVPVNGSLSISPSMPLSNTTVSSIIPQPTDTYKGRIDVDKNGVVSISNAEPIGTHTITIHLTDNCGAISDGVFLLNVVGSQSSRPVFSYNYIQESANSHLEVISEVPFKGSLTIAPTTGPSGNTSVSSTVVDSKGTLTGT